MKTHELKIWPRYFNDLLKRKKSFEIRRNDRRFAVRDILILREWDPSTKEFTGRELKRRVKYKVAGVEAEGFGMKPGYCVLGLGMVRAPKVHTADGDPDLEDLF